MTDRELLELAAKAAGIDFGFGKDQWFWSDHGRHGAGIYEAGRHSFGYWNPLTNDGDALRLAVKLKIGIRFTWDGCDDQYDAVWAETGRTRCDEELGMTPKGEQFDEEAATRRAIVRAAAELRAA
jgi:hypothetical protein